MVSFILWAAPVLAGTFGIAQAQTQEKVVPRPNSTYAVGLTTLQVVDYNAVELFAPNREPRAFELSIFFPAAQNSTTNAPYFPPETARLLDIEHSSQEFQLDVTNGTFEQLYMTIATNGTSIAPGRWPTLLFSGAEGTTRLMYNSIAAHVSSSGYVVITIDTPYDTDVVQFSNGTIDLFNQTIGTESDSQLEIGAIEDVNGRSQDATFLLDYFSNSSSVIPGCNDCLNLTHVGYFGHSIGGATATTVQLNESRIAGSLNYDGAIWGDVVQQGLDRPYMLFTNESRASQNETENSSWGLIWPNLRGPKFNMILADAEHYTFSDLPVIVETLGLTPSAESMALEQITNLNGDRALNIVVSYTVAFFDFVFQAKNSSLLQGPGSLFPEVSFDNSTGSSTTSPSTTSGAGNMQPREWVWALFFSMVGVLTASSIN